jgi:hypothetical protein
MDGMSFVDFAADSDAGPEPSGRTVKGYPDWRIGVPGSGNLFGLIKVGGPRAAPDAPAQPAAPDPYPPPPAYVYDANGRLQLNPAFAKTHPQGPFDFGAMAHNIDWPGAALDLASIGAASLPLAGAAAVDVLKTIPQLGIDAWRELHHDTMPANGKSGG